MYTGTTIIVSSGASSPTNSSPTSRRHYSTFLHPNGHHSDARSSKSTFEHDVVSSQGHDEALKPAGSKKRPGIRQRVTSLVRRKSSAPHQHQHQHHENEQGTLSFPASADSEDSTSAGSSHHPHERNRVKSMFQKLTPGKAVSG